MNNHRMDYLATGSTDSLIKSMNPAFWKTVKEMQWGERWDRFSEKYKENLEMLGMTLEDDIDLVTRASWVVHDQMNAKQEERSRYKAYPQGFDRRKNFKQCRGALAWAKRRGYKEGDTAWYAFIDDVRFDFNLGPEYLTIGVNGVSRRRFYLRALNVKNGELHVLNLIAVSKRDHFEIIDISDSKYVC